MERFQAHELFRRFSNTSVAMYLLYILSLYTDYLIITDVWVEYQKHKNQLTTRVNKYYLPVLILTHR